MHDRILEARRWLDQADNDLAFARYALEGGYFHQACFIAQQSAEKAIKSLHYYEGARTVIGHSVVGLLAPLLASRPGLAALNDDAAELDLFYIPTRYPNGLAGGIPHRAFTRAQAARAIDCAQRILTAVKNETDR